jgi:xylulokinase
MPLYPAITWMDGRTEGLVKEWREAGVEELVRPASGWHLYPGLCLPTIAWLGRYRPDVFAATEHWLSINDYLVHRMTGRFCMNPSNGGGMQLVDIRSGQWSRDLCALVGIDPGQLSPIQASGAIIGEITPEASRLTGLPGGTMVINGGHDQGCTALGLGITSPGKILLACGTAWVVTGVVEVLDVGMLPDRLDINSHPLPLRSQGPRRWMVSQSLGGLGASLEWLLRQCWQGTDAESMLRAMPEAARRDGYAALDDELSRTRAGGDGLFFMPLTGGHNEPIGELRGSIVGLRLDHTRADVARALMEGAAYELRQALEQIRCAGMPIQRMWMTGGAAQSPLWSAILADVTGVPLVLPQYKYWPAVGAAILAGLGGGAFESLAAAQARFQKPARQVEPDQANMSIYGEYFAAYRHLGDQIDHLWS